MVASREELLILFSNKSSNSFIFFKNRVSEGQIAEYALHEELLPRRRGAGLLSRISKWRALVVSRVNRLWCSCIDEHRISLVSASTKTLRQLLLYPLRVQERRLYPWLTDPSAFRSAPSRLAPPPHYAAPRLYLFEIWPSFRFVL